MRGAVEVAVSSPAELLHLLAMGMRARATSATGVHGQSSRSHALCYIRVRDGVCFLWLAHVATAVLLMLLLVLL